MSRFQTHVRNLGYTLASHGPKMRIIAVHSPPDPRRVASSLVELGDGVGETV